MRAFEKTELFADGEMVGEAQVYGGEKSGVALKAKGPVSIFVPITNRDRLVARIVYQGPVTAPVKEGTPVGVLRVWIGDDEPGDAALRRRVGRARHAAPARARCCRRVAGRLAALDPVRSGVTRISAVAASSARGSRFHLTRPLLYIRLSAAVEGAVRH